MYERLITASARLTSFLVQCLQVCWGLWAGRWIWSWLILAAAETLKKRYEFGRAKQLERCVTMEKCQTYITYILGLESNNLCQQEIYCFFGTDASGQQLSQSHDRRPGPGTFVSSDPEYSRGRSQGSQTGFHHRAAPQPLLECGGSLY